MFVDWQYKHIPILFWYTVKYYISCKLQISFWGGTKIRMVWKEQDQNLCKVIEENLLAVSYILPSGPADAERETEAEKMDVNEWFYI